MKFWLTIDNMLLVWKQFKQTNVNNNNNGGKKVSEKYSIIWLLFCLPQCPHILFRTFNISITNSVVKAESKRCF